MLSKFREFFQDKKLFRPDDSILLAVSGGIDSMVMMALFREAGVRFGVAHCNFLLRGRESDGDERFVKRLAGKCGVPFFSKHFQTGDYAGDRGISIQMAARELRYAWFRELAEQKGYDYIATAHHLGDQAETVLINLARGTGISGLHGILPKQGRIVRPLLFASREDIAEYAAANKIKHREDSSNASAGYVRNRIRRDVMPVLKAINPEIERTIAESAERVREAESIFRAKVEEVRRKVSEEVRRGGRRREAGGGRREAVSKGGGETDGMETRMAIGKVKMLRPLHFWLYELLQPFGFGQSDVKNIAAALDAGPGRQFHSATHTLLRDRQHLVIRLRMTGSRKKEAIKIDGSERMVESDGLRLKIEIKDKVGGFRIPSDTSVGCLDMDCLKFPLTVRRWRSGDAFRPLGMKGMKKLSDFLTDRKLSLFEKENVYVLLSGKDIAWVVGYRIDDRFKVAHRTRMVYWITSS